MIGCIIQARMGSSRLPNKTMKLIDKKIPMLEQVIDQIKFCKDCQIWRIQFSEQALIAKNILMATSVY